METLKYSLDNIISMYTKLPNRDDPCAKIIQNIINLLENTFEYARQHPLNDEDLFKYIFDNKNKYNINKFIHPEHAVESMQTKLDYILSIFVQITNSIVNMINEYNSLDSKIQKHHREKFSQRCKELEAQIPCFELNIEHIDDMIFGMRRPPTPPPIISLSDLEFQNDGGFSVFYNTYKHRINKETGDIRIGMFMSIVLKCFAIALCRSNLNYEDAKQKFTDANFKKFVKDFNILNVLNYEPEMDFDDRYNLIYNKLEEASYVPVIPEDFIKNCETETLDNINFTKKYIKYNMSEASHSNLNKDFKRLYLKYKQKYLTLKNNKFNTLHF
jgi:hypothetical protein